MTKATWADQAIKNALNNPQQLLLVLDEENNELSVRERLASGRYDAWQSRVVEEWLRRKSDERQAEAAARADAREEETLSIAREANSIARSQAAAAWRAARYAMYAAAIATIAALLASKDQIFALIFCNS